MRSRRKDNVGGPGRVGAGADGAILADRMDPLAAPPTAAGLGVATLLVVLGFALGIATSRRLGRWRAHRRATRKGREAHRAETDAGEAIRSHGFAIVDTQVEGEAHVLVDGERVERSVRADYGVERDGRPGIVEVKSGSEDRRPEDRETRRQLLEYALVFPDRDLFHLDVGTGELSRVEFDYPVEEREERAPAREGWTWLLTVAAAMANRVPLRLDADLVSDVTDPGVSEPDLLHVTTKDEWERGRETGHLRPASLDDVGFVHLCTPAQAVGVLDAFFRGREDLLLLVVDPARLGAELRWEDPAPPDPDREPEAHAGQLFPHLYGPLEVEAVREARPIHPGPDGRFTLVGAGSTPADPSVGAGLTPAREKR